MAKNQLLRCGAFGLFVFLLIASVGCGRVDRRLVVTSEPSGASVRLNGDHVGQTPVDVPFVWYWFYDLEVEKEGFETDYKRVRLQSPWYLWPPLDLAAEVVPIRVVDRKEVHFDLTGEQFQPSPVWVW